jgi:hypothetical protein
VVDHGFIPSFLTYPGKIDDIIILMENLDTPVEVLSFFHDITFPEHIAIFEMLTQEASLELHRILDDTTSMLRWTYPHLLYSQSQRLKTDMSMFRTPFSNTGRVERQKLETDFGSYEILSLESKTSITMTSGKYAVPVTRYAGSVTSGRYHGEPEQSYCGTFYYHEPESQTYLIGKKILIAETKYEATEALFRVSNVNGSFHNHVEDLLESHMIVPMNYEWEKKKLPLDLMLTPEQFISLYEKYYQETVDRLKASFRGKNFSDEILQVPIYSGMILGLYAQEDNFDQPLCILGKEIGYDIIILTRMVGAKQIVIEVLDTRSREESLQNLIFT